MAALKSELWSVLDICWKSAWLRLPNLISLLGSYARSWTFIAVSSIYFNLQSLYGRALRICSPKYLNDKFDYIENSFLSHLYRKPFIHFAKSKALKIHNRNRSWTAINTPSDEIKFPHKHIILPQNSSPNFIGNSLNKVCIKTVTLSSKTIRDLLHSSPRHDIISNVGVYCIPCKRREMFRNIYIDIGEILD